MKCWLGSLFAWQFDDDDDADTDAQFSNWEIINLKIAPRPSLKMQRVERTNESHF